MSRYNKYEKRFGINNKIIQMPNKKGENMRNQIELRKEVLHNGLAQDRKKEFSKKNYEIDEVICLHKQIEELKNENELLTKLIAYFAKRIS